MFSLEGDEITAFWPNDTLTFPFYMSFSKSIPNWTTLKEVFDLLFILESDQMTVLWPNDVLIFTFYVTL